MLTLSGSAFAVSGESSGPHAAEPQVFTGTVAPLRLEADLSERKLRVYHGGELVETYAIAVGEPEHPTPTGEFTTSKVIWNPAWVPPPKAEWAKEKENQAPGDPDNPMKAVKIFFQEPDYYIHGTDATHTLGEAESHGCLRMAPADAERLAQRVQEHGGEPRSEAWYAKVKQQKSDTYTITLPDPVSITIRE